MYKLFFISLIVSLSFSACQSKYKSIPINKPTWINSPQKEGKVGAIGSAMPHFKGKTAQRKLAISRALDELAQQSGVQVQSSIIRNEKRSGKQTQSSAEVFTIQNSANETIHAHIEKTWTNPRTKEVYVWLVAD